MKSINYLLLGVVVLASSAFWSPIIEDYSVYMCIHGAIGICLMVYAIYKVGDE